MPTVFSVDAHAEGEPCRVVTAGIPTLPGAGIRERRDHFRAEYDRLRTSLMHEPRGHGGMFGALLVPPEREDSAFGLIFFDPVGYLDGCGHATLCAAAVWHRIIGPVSVPFQVDNPDGSVTRVVELRPGPNSCTATLEMPPARVLAQELDVQGVSDGAVGLARCGNTYLAVPARTVGIPDLAQAPAATIRSEARQVRERAAPLLRGRADVPEGPAEDWLEVILYQQVRSGRDEREAPLFSTAVLFSGTQLDRSPCGTGSCALFRLLVARNEVSPSPGLTTAGPLEGRFVLEAPEAGGPEDEAADHGEDMRFRLTGSAHITGVHEWILGEEDRLRDGFRFEELG